MSAHLPLFVGVWFSSFVAPAPAESDSSQALRLEDGTLVVSKEEGDVRRHELLCRGRAFFVHEKSLYIACEEAAVLIYPFDGEVLGTPRKVSVEGAVQGFFQHRDGVWVELRSVRAVPLSGFEATSEPARDSGATGAAGELEKPQASEPELEKEEVEVETAIEGKVVEVRDEGYAVVSLGSESGIEIGTHLQVFERIEKLVGAEGGLMVQERERVVGRVIAVSEGYCELELGTGEQLMVGWLARPTDRKLTRSKAAPARVSGMWDIAMGIRPFLPITEELGIGAISDLGVSYRFEKPVALHLRSEPLTFAFSKQSRYAVSVVGIAAYDHQLFELGVGAGIYTYNDRSFDTVDSNGNSIDGALEPYLQLSIAQLLRIGATDGLNLTLRNQFLLDGSFSWGTTVAAGQFPLSRRTWLLFRGGGGVGDFGYGEMGLRILVRGNGRQDSVFVTPAAGWGGLDENAGPLVGVDVEWRPRR